MAKGKSARGKAVKEAKGVGRPPKYTPKFVELAFELCRIGAVDADLALAFGVHEDTINEWKKKYPEFSVSIKKGKAHEDENVAKKLIERAKGATRFQDKEVKIKRVWYDANGKKCEEERVEIVRLEIQEPPDTTALIFFLKNRRKDLWRDKVDVGVGGIPDEPVAFEFDMGNG